MVATGFICIFFRGPGEPVFVYTGSFFLSSIMSFNSALILANDLPFLYCCRTNFFVLGQPELFPMIVSYLENRFSSSFAFDLLSASALFASFFFSSASFLVLVRTFKYAFKAEIFAFLLNLALTSVFSLLVAVGYFFNKLLNARCLFATAFVSAAALACCFLLPAFFRTSSMTLLLTLFKFLV